MQRGGSEVRHYPHRNQVLYNSGFLPSPKSHFLYAQDWINLQIPVIGPAGESGIIVLFLAINDLFHLF